MFKKRAIIMFLCLFPLMITGCWDAADIEDLAIPIAASYDLHEGTEYNEGQKVKYDVTNIIPNFSPEAKKKFRVEEVSGVTLGNTRDKRVYESPRKHILSMIKVFVFGENMARSGLNPVSDPLFRISQIPNNMNLTVAEGRGDEILKTPVNNYANTGVYLKELAANTEKNTFVVNITLHELGINTDVPGKNPVLPLIKKEKDKIVISGTAIFKKDKMIAKINTQETRSLVLLRGLKSRGYIPFIIKENEEVKDEGTVFVSNSRKVKVNRQGDKYTFKVTVNLEGNLIEHTNRGSLMENKQMVKDIEDQVAMDMKKECEQFINKMQEEFKIDCIDISRYALAKWRNELNSIIDTEFIENVNIEIDVKVKIKNTGEVT